MKFQLEIQQAERTCIFKLIWGQGQQISTALPYPEILFSCYQAWRRDYLNFYKNFDSTSFRARVRKPKNEEGTLNIPQDRQRQLVQSSAKMLKEFQRWLRREELYEIRATIAQEKTDNELNTLFITCNGELQRLPWEAWDLGAEFGYKIAIARSPINITSPNKNKINRSRKPRILAILGDDTGLDLNSDRNSIQSLEKIAEVKVVTWQPQQPPSKIKQQIQEALTDKKGWEILFFAGHSNETAITGGELAIAPNIALSIDEIAPQLKIAQANGLQFALFNSCSGLSIANSSIDLGLSQVGIMREPIHNKVAQVFLVQFLQALASYRDVREALIAAGQYLKEQKALYPAAYLIPSLYCHPDARLFKIEPWRWRKKIKKWLPNRKEAIAVASVCLLSVLPPVQNLFLDVRVLVQSIYRDATNQLPTTTAPVVLIHIDEASLAKADIKQPVPMDRSYLASLVDRLKTANAKIVAIDYLFDRPQPENDPVLAKSIRQGVEDNQTWYIFGAYKQIDDREIGVSSETKIGNVNWTLQGYTDGLPNYMSLPEENCDRVCPFTYLLATVKTLERQLTPTEILQPDTKSKTNLRQQIYRHVEQNNSDFAFIKNTKLSRLTSLSQYFGQQWLRPIQDFSVPPDLAYHRLSAWKLLDPTQSISPAQFRDRVTVIGAGGYAQAGLNAGSDNFATPTALKYWYSRRDPAMTESQFTGSELLAYMTYNLINRRLVIPIPDLWLAIAALLIARTIQLNRDRTTFSFKWLLIVVFSITIYGLVGLQLYISQAILLPWLLPSIAISASLLPKYKDS